MTKMIPFILIALILLTAILMTACAVPKTISEERPDDFQTVYHWSTGSLPPPYHYHYTIAIGPEAQGTIVFTAGYSDDGPLVWTETFPLSEDEMDALYARLHQIGVFSKTWQQVEDVLGGGSVYELSVTAYRKVYNIPAYIDGAEQARDMRAMADELKALVPQSIWDDLYAKHNEYVIENE